MVRKRLVFRIARKKIHKNFLSSLLTLLKINVSYLELFIRHFFTAIENIRFEIYFLFLNSNIHYFSRRLFAKHQTLTSWCRIFSSRSRSCKVRILSISKFFLFIVVILTSILLKPAFWQNFNRSFSLSHNKQGAKK